MTMAPPSQLHASEQLDKEEEEVDAQGSSLSDFLDSKQQQQPVYQALTLTYTPLSLDNNSELEPEALSETSYSTDAREKQQQQQSGGLTVLEEEDEGEGARSLGWKHLPDSPGSSAGLPIPSIREEQPSISDENVKGYQADESTGSGWHPLTPSGSQSRSREEGEPLTFQNDEGATAAAAGHTSTTLPKLEVNLVPPPSTSAAAAGEAQSSRTPIEVKPASPQPWDLVDPPESNGPSGDYYSPRSKFATLQSRLPSAIPKSSYYFGPPPSDSAFGTKPVGQIGLHHPREIIRLDRDYTGGEIPQIAPIYPLELEGRITPTQFLESMNAINEILISSYSLTHSFLDNFLQIATLHLSRLVYTSHYQREMERLHRLIDQLNAEIYNPVGLNILWPRKVAFLFLEIEYY